VGSYAVAAFDDIDMGIIVIVREVVRQETDDSPTCPLNTCTLPVSHQMHIIAIYVSRLLIKIHQAIKNGSRLNMYMCLSYLVEILVSVYL